MMRKIFLSTIFLTFLFFNDVSAQNTSSPEAESIRDKVKEKLDEIRNSPKAYFGTVTDKTEDSVQIQEDGDEIKFVAVDQEEVAFAQSGKVNKTIKYEDIAIGDFIIAMGYGSENTVLVAKRIVTTEKPEDVDRNVLVATIEDVGTNELTVIENNTNDKFLITTSRNTVVTKSVDNEILNARLTELSAEQNIIFIVEKDEEELFARRILIVSEVE